MALVTGKDLLQPAQSRGKMEQVVGLGGERESRCQLENLECSSSPLAGAQFPSKHIVGAINWDHPGLEFARITFSIHTTHFCKADQLFQILLEEFLFHFADNLLHIKACEKIQIKPQVAKILGTVLVPLKSIFCLFFGWHQGSIIKCEDIWDPKEELTFLTSYLIASLILLRLGRWCSGHKWMFTSPFRIASTSSVSLHRSSTPTTKSLHCIDNFLQSF